MFVNIKILEKIKEKEIKEKNPPEFTSPRPKTLGHSELIVPCA